jgi:hypothetical protein
VTVATIYTRMAEKPPVGAAAGSQDGRGDARSIAVVVRQLVWRDNREHVGRAVDTGLGRVDAGRLADDAQRLSVRV